MRVYCWRGSGASCFRAGVWMTQLDTHPSSFTYRLTVSRSPDSVPQKPHRKNGEDKGIQLTGLP